MCWLCEGKSERKVIGYVDDTVLWLGKRKTGEVKFWSTSEYGIDCNFYKPNFCPECGKDLIEEEMKMEPNIVTYGVCNETFYVIQRYGTYYDIWWVDKVPTDMTTKGIKNFMEEYCLDGCSVAGSYKTVMKELANLILDLT